MCPFTLEFIFIRNYWHNIGSILNSFAKNIAPTLEYWHFTNYCVIIDKQYSANKPSIGTLWKIISNFNFTLSCKKTKIKSCRKNKVFERNKKLKSEKVAIVDQTVDYF